MFVCIRDSILDRRRLGCLHQGFHLRLKKTGMFASEMETGTFAFGIPSLIEDRGDKLMLGFNRGPCNYI